MNLHEHEKDFKTLISIVAKEKHIPETAVERDYYILMLLKNLEQSEYAEKCVFKGGTSLSKGYPGSIERFSEDIDLTYLGMDCTDKQCDKAIKGIEKVMTAGANTQKIPEERSNRSKSMYVWFGSVDDRIKLEIGSSVRPDPFSKKTIKSYIHEYLEQNELQDVIKEFGLEPVTINILNIERTFVDKIMSVKRHAICGTLNHKVRHIYDVTRLFEMPEIQQFLEDKEELKRLIQLTKNTDSFYLEKRNVSVEYNPLEAYSFTKWRGYFDEEIESIYEKLHENLLYTDEKQSFDKAVSTFLKINEILADIGE